MTAKTTQIEVELSDETFEKIEQLAAQYEVSVDEITTFLVTFALSEFVAGRLTVSGLLARQANRVLTAHRGFGLHLRQRIDIGPWTTLVMSRKKA